MVAVNEASLLPTVPVVGTCARTTALAAPALITILPVVDENSVPSVTFNVYVPAVFRMRLLNVATPFTAVAVSVLPEVKPPGPLCTAIVTAEVFDVTTLP